MKIFIFLLVLLNAGYLLLSLKQTPHPPVNTRGDLSVPLLTLIEEGNAPPLANSTVDLAPDPARIETRAAALRTMEPAAVTTVAVAAVAPPQEGAPKTPEPKEAVPPAKEPAAPVKTAVKSCFTLGPFRDGGTADATARQLTAAGGSLTKRSASERRTRGYWVYLPPQPNRQRAQAVADKLAAAGFKDYFIVSDPKANNAISLGLFTVKAGSEQRVAELEAMGFRPRVEVRTEETTVSWLDLTIATQDDWQRRLKNDPAEPFDVIPRKCP
ncbi:MAG: SPOR domain-containing protein [Thiotrichales bacterium]